MDWVGQAAAWLREMSAQRWLEAWQPTLAQTPDWALLATAPTLLLLFVLMLRLTWPRSQRPSRAKTEPKAQPTSAPTQSRQEPAPPRVEPKPAAKPQAPAPTPAPKPVVAKAAATPAPAPSATADDNEDRVVRVFISSTFIDMDGEREALVKKTFPALRTKFRARGVEFLAVDLRWGVTEDDVRTGKTLPICLTEVDRCEPYFLGLLGERYGSLLTPDKLTPERIADFPVLGDGLGRSLTEIEIMQGVLRKPKTANRALFFQRDPAWLETLSAPEREKYETSNDDDRAKLAELKARIRASGAQIINYACPEDIGAAVEAALSQQIDAQFPDTDAPTPFELTMRLHRAYARERRGLHVGAAHYRTALDQWMAKRDAPPLLITGESGGGKSTLVANWLHAWRAAHPGDIVFEHYLGASPDSADPLGLMRRLWEQLNRDTGHAVELPAGDVELMEFSSGLSERLARATAFAERKGAQILIALDGFDKLSSEQNLRWLPNVPHVKLVASSLDSEAKSAALARGWTPLDVKPLGSAERGEFIERTLEGWGRKLAREQASAILAHAQAGNPLFLGTVLDELRVSASNDSLKDRLNEYLGARDLPDLFDRVLARLEDDCEPGLVAKALPLIWASRAGLEETEIIAITDTQPLFWATLRNGLGDALRDQAGRMTFAHDYMRHAIETRYLADEEKIRLNHLAVADHFTEAGPSDREAEELPFQLREAAAWDRLEAVMIDLKRFAYLKTRGREEVLGYWRALESRGRSPESLLCDEFTQWANGAWSLETLRLGIDIGHFLSFAGRGGQTCAAMIAQVAAASERHLGPEHALTFECQLLLARNYLDLGELERAEKLVRAAQASLRKARGAQHEETLNCCMLLAEIRSQRGDAIEAEMEVERVVQARTSLLGANHPETLASMERLASYMRRNIDIVGADEKRARCQAIQEGVVATYKHLFGASDLTTIAATNNLAETLAERERYDEARILGEQTLEATRSVLGDDHPNTIKAMLNLAGSLAALNQTSQAEALESEAVARSARTLGREHLITLTAMHFLSTSLVERGALQEALDLQEHVFATRNRILGRAHDQTHAAWVDRENTKYALGIASIPSGAEVSKEPRRDS